MIGNVYTLQKTEIIIVNTNVAAVTSCENSLQRGLGLSQLTTIIIHIKQLLDSDWLRAVQFKRNTTAKSVTPVQITHRNSGL